MRLNDIPVTAQMIDAAPITEREKRILRQYLGIGVDTGRRSLREIGREEGVTGARIHQIKQGALLQIRLLALREMEAA